jgi:uncharacterized protein (TIGR03000 family)
MTWKFNRIMQVMGLAIICASSMATSVWAQPPAYGYGGNSAYYPGAYYRTYNPNTTGWYTTGPAPYYYGQPTYYDYGLGFPVNGAFMRTNPTTTSFYQGSSANAPDRTVHLRVIVSDPNADVVVQGTKTNTSGTVREFQSPALEDGTYTYEVKATWMENRQSKTKTESIRVKPGSWSVVDFQRPSTAQ